MNAKSKTPKTVQQNSANSADVSNAQRKREEQALSKINNTHTVVVRGTIYADTERKLSADCVITFWPLTENDVSVSRTHLFNCVSVLDDVRAYEIKKAQNTLASAVLGADRKSYNVSYTDKRGKTVTDKHDRSKGRATRKTSVIDVRQDALSQVSFLLKKLEIIAVASEHSVSAQSKQEAENAKRERDDAIKRAELLAKALAEQGVDVNALLASLSASE